MMIWKFTLRAVDGIQPINVPNVAKAKVRSVLHGRKTGEIDVWIEVSPDNDAMDGALGFVVYGTGHEQDTNRFAKHEFVGTVHDPNLSLVWHVYEVAVV